VFNDVVKDGENEENLDKCEIKGAKIFSSQPWGRGRLVVIRKEAIAV